MFYCFIHNWYSTETQCPACMKTVTTTTIEVEDKPVQEEFVWTDELVKEYFEWLPKPMIGEKQQWDKDMFALFKRPNSEVEPEPKRIEVSVDGSFDSLGFDKTNYHFTVHNGKRLRVDEFPLIKKAIEQVLNNEPPIAKSFTEEDMLKCFDESRKTNPIVGFKHDTFPAISTPLNETQ